MGWRKKRKLKDEIEWGAIEKEIRKEIGEAEVNRALLRSGNLPNIEMVGSFPIWKGELTLRLYRVYFPNADNYATVYLQLVEHDPRLAEIVALYYQIKRDIQVVLEGHDDKPLSTLKEREKTLEAMIYTRLHDNYK